jgi:chromosome condensin MukBEF MukE localization factor
MVKKIVDSSFEDFNFTVGGVEMVRDVESFGYLNARSSMLIPEEIAKKTYYKIDFLMKKVK